MTKKFRDVLGQAVRGIWIEWAMAQPDVADHPSWTAPWSALSDRDREVDRMIGERLYEMGFYEARGKVREAISNVRPE